MRRLIIDCETDGLIETVTKIHCFCYYDLDTRESVSLVELEDIKTLLFSSELTLIGHNIVRFDIPVLEKVLKIKIDARLVDTLALSWYLYSDRPSHGLESWGTDLGVEKPTIKDWKNQTLEDYLFRCEEDVKINTSLFNLQLEYLSRLYNNDSDQLRRIINYLTFKLECAREQEEVKFKLDVEKCKTNLAFLSSELTSKTERLIEVMPLVTKYYKMPRPKNIYKKDNTEPTEVGKRWLDALRSQNLPNYHVGTILIPRSQEKGNPGSHKQLKSWLDSLGWVPMTFSYTKQEDGTIKKIPQINDSVNGTICESVRLLYDKAPELEALEGYFVVRHRMGILRSFLKDVDSVGFLKAEIIGLTNTLRFQHTTIVNLPQMPKPYWEKIRECLIAPDENHILCGTDMSGLEDSTKRHYMYYYDPEYVQEMMEDNFDPHIDVAVLGGLLTKEQGEEHKLYDRTKGIEGRSYKAKRLMAKKVNFASVYGAGPPKISLSSGMSIADAKLLHGVYWQRNWAVKKVAESCIIKTIGGKMWLLNPVSQFWLSLRIEKDKFSTLNQSTGVYAFDTWVRHSRARGIKLCAQFHDEQVNPVLKGEEKVHTRKLLEALVQTNAQLQLNVELKISIDYGYSYKDVH